MALRLNPYISFDGRAGEAMAFYRDIFGGELTTTTYGESGMAQESDDGNRVMHAQLDAPNGMTLMASDSPPGMPHQPPAGVSLSLSGDDEAQLSGYWDRLADGGTVTMPLEAAPWGDKFGMVTDRYGVPWMVNIAGDRQPD